MVLPYSDIDVRNYYRQDVGYKPDQPNDFDCFHARDMAAQWSHRIETQGQLFHAASLEVLGNLQSEQTLQPKAILPGVTSMWATVRDQENPSNIFSISYTQAEPDDTANPARWSIPSLKNITFRYEHGQLINPMTHVKALDMNNGWIVMQRYEEKAVQGKKSTIWAAIPSSNPMMMKASAFRRLYRVTPPPPKPWWKF